MLSSLALLLAMTAAEADPAATAGPRAAYEAGRAAQDGRSKRAHFQRGIDLAQARLAARADDPEGLYWLAVNLGAEALERGKMAALPVVPRMEKLLLRLDQVAPRYEDAGAARVLGRLYHQAPAVISVGSNDNARRFLERALALAPEHPGNLAFAADFLLDVDGARARARSLAEKCLAKLDPRDTTHDVTEWRKLATRVLEKTR